MTAFATDARSVRGAVLLALRRPGFSCVLAIPAKDWDPVKTAEALGLEVSAPSHRDFNRPVR